MSSIKLFELVTTFICQTPVCLVMRFDCVEQFAELFSPTLSRETVDFPRTEIDNQRIMDSHFSRDMLMNLLTLQQVILQEKIILFLEPESF